MTEAIFSCRVLSTLNSIWYSELNRKARGVDLPNKYLPKGMVIGNKDLILSDGLLSHEYLSSVFVGGCVFPRTRRIKRKMGHK